MDQATDEDLYSQMIKGQNDKAFLSLYDRHSKPLFRFIYRFTLNSQSTEEILQDIFTQLLSGKFNLEPNANLKSWLYTIAKNKSINHLKKVSFEVANESVIESAISENNTEENYHAESILTKLHVLEKKLPLDLMQTWQLRKDGLDYSQIAQQLAIPVGTVKSRFSRLVEYLKREFQS